MLQQIDSDVGSKTRGGSWIYDLLFRGAGSARGWTSRSPRATPEELLLKDSPVTFVKRKKSSQQSLDFSFAAVAGEGSDPQRSSSKELLVSLME